MYGKRVTFKAADDGKIETMQQTNLCGRWKNLVMGIAMGGGQHTLIRTKCKHLATILRYFKYIFN